MPTSYIGSGGSVAYSDASRVQGPYRNVECGYSIFIIDAIFELGAYSPKQFIIGNYIIEVINDKITGKQLYNLSEAWSRFKTKNRTSTAN